MAKLILADLHDALRAADLPDEKAWAPATTEFDRRIERIESNLTLGSSLLGVTIAALMLGGFNAAWAQLAGMSAKLGA